MICKFTPTSVLICLVVNSKHCFGTFRLRAYHRCTMEQIGIRINDYQSAFIPLPIKVCLELFKMHIVLFFAFFEKNILGDKKMKKTEFFISVKDLSFRTVDILLTQSFVHFENENCSYKIFSLM